MPELPDVEINRRYLETHALGRRVMRVEVRHPGALRVTPRSDVSRLATGRVLDGTRRHGKYLFARLDEGAAWLVFHFGMNGRLEHSPSVARRTRGDAHVAVVIHFERGDGLVFYDPRKFGRFEAVEDADDYVRRRGLGPDALSLDRDGFAAILESARGTIKPLLMNQSAIAGLGNIYVDEVLFQAGLHPASDTRGFDAATRFRLHDVTRRVLAMAIARGADDSRLPRSYLSRRRAGGAPCPRCGGRLRSARHAGRTSYYCPTHQRRIRRRRR